MKKQLLVRTSIIFAILYVILGILQIGIFKYSVEYQQQDNVKMASKQLGIRNGELTPESRELLEKQFLNARIEWDGEVIRSFRGDDDDKVTSRTIEREVAGQTLKVSFPTHEENEIMFTQLIIYTVVVAIIFTIVFWLYQKILRRTLRPLDELSEQVRELTIDQMGKAVSVKQAPIEVEQLEKAIQKMQQRVQQAFEKEKETKKVLEQFVSDASHELKTPLTSIRGFTEVLLRSNFENVQQVEDSVTQIHLQTERMSALIERLLQLSRLDRQEPLQLEMISFNELVEDLMPVLEVLGEKREMNYVLQSEQSQQMDVMKMQQVVMNLVQNAIRYSDDGSKITIKAYGTKLEVIDEGRGIEQEKLPYIFRRFYRVDTDRARSTGGEGLGLAIAKEIVEQHGGTIQVTSTVNVGSCFTITLPKE